MERDERTYDFKLEFMVRDYEVDSEGIVNNACYLNYFEHTRHEFCRHVGFTFRRMRELRMSPVVRRAEVDYLRSLGLGESFTSLIRLERRGPRFVFHQWIENEAGETVVQADITIVNVIDGRPTRGDELAAPFAAYLGE